MLSPDPTEGMNLWSLSGKGGHEYSNPFAYPDLVSALGWIVHQRKAAEGGRQLKMPTLTHPIGAVSPCLPASEPTCTCRRMVESTIGSKGQRRSLSQTLACSSGQDSQAGQDQVGRTHEPHPTALGWRWFTQPSATGSCSGLSSQEDTRTRPERPCHHGS